MSATTSLTKESKTKKMQSDLTSALDADLVCKVGTVLWRTSHHPSISRSPNYLVSSLHHFLPRHPTAQIDHIVSDPTTDATLSTFASSIPTAISLPTPRAQFMAFKKLATEAVVHASKQDEPNSTPTHAHELASVMVELLSDVLLSPGSRPLHRPILSALKTLPPTTYLESMHYYLADNIQLIICMSNPSSSNEKDGDAKDTYATNATNSHHPVYLAESLLLFKEHAPAVTLCAVALIEYSIAQIDDVIQCNSGSPSPPPAHTAAQDSYVHTCLTVIASIMDIFASSFHTGSTGTDDADEYAARVHRQQEEEEEEERKKSVGEVVRCCLAMLRHHSSFLSTDCLSTAASVICKAASLPNTPPSFVVSTIINAIAGGCSSGGDLSSSVPWIEEYLLRHAKEKSTLHNEMIQLPARAMLCMLRGLLQGVSLDALTTTTTTTTTAATTTTCPLTDGMIPTLCDAIVLTIDTPTLCSIAATTLTNCLERIAQQYDRKDPSHPPCPLPPPLQNKIVETLWVCWDAQNTGVSKVAQQAFREVIRIVKLQNSSGDNGSSNGIKAPAQEFWGKVAVDVLQGFRADDKRRYGPLTAIIPHMGAMALLSASPALVQDTIQAMGRSRSVCGVASIMLTALWSNIMAVHKEEEEEDRKRDMLRPYWFPPTLQALLSGCTTITTSDVNVIPEEETIEEEDQQTLRYVTSTYVVPAVVAVDPTAIDTLLSALSQHFSKNITTDTGTTSIDGRKAQEKEEAISMAIIDLLAVGRKCHVISDLPMPTTTKLNVMDVLRRSVSSCSAPLRAGALSLLCVHPKNTVLPTGPELELVQTALTIDMHTTSPSQRQIVLSSIGRLLVRIRFSVGAVGARPREFPPEAAVAVAGCESWLQRFSAAILASAHPGAQYGRRFLAVDILCMLLEVFQDHLLPTVPPLHIDDNYEGILHVHTKETSDVCRGVRRKGASSLVALRKRDGGGGAQLAPSSFRPFPPHFYSSSTVLTLTSCLMDTWDRVRRGAGEGLLLLPAPLPGFDTPEDVVGLLRFGLGCLSSPKLKHADTGARIVLLVYQQCVVDLGWRIGVYPAPAAYCSRFSHPTSRHAAIIDFLATMVGLVGSRVMAGEEDVIGASKESLAHGPLMALRYLIPVTPWDMLMANAESRESVRYIFRRLMSWLHRLNVLILPVLSTPETMTRVGAADVVAHHTPFDDFDDVDVDMDGVDVVVKEEELQQAEDSTTTTTTNKGQKRGGVLGPEAQVVTVACWMNAKELALTIGTLSQSSPMVQPPQSTTSTPPLGGLLPPPQIHLAGDLLLSALLYGKHNGAVDKTQQGLEALANCVLGADKSTGLHDLPIQWYDRVMAHLRRPGQSRRDVVRRSAGLPYAIQSLVRARSQGGGVRPLAHRGVQELLAIANAGNSNTTTTSSDEHDSVWPRVHAFNALRFIYLDQDIVREVRPFHAQGFINSILALVAPQWDVRNAAMLCFTALLVRVLGFSNVASTGKRAMTAVEFFTAYPSLLPFLLGQLQGAAESLEKRGGGRGGDGTGSTETEMVDELHPSLSPILTLLARMKPSSSSSSGGGGGGVGVGGNDSIRANGTTKETHEDGTDEGQEVSALVSSILNDAPRTNNTSSSSAVGGVSSCTYESLIPFIQRCAGARQMAVRAQAARALPPLISPPRMPGTVQQLVKNINAAYIYTMEMHGGESMNKVHGDMLQLCELLSTLVVLSSRTNGTDDCTTIVQEVIQHIGSELDFSVAKCVSTVGRYPCAPLTHAFLRCIIQASLLLSKNTNSKGSSSSSSEVELGLKVVDTASQGAWQGILHTTKRGDGDGDREEDDIMLGVALKEATLLHLLHAPSLVHTTPYTHTEWIDSFVMAVQHRRSEVRSSAMKALLRMLEKQEKLHEEACSSTASIASLYTILCVHLSADVGEHHKKTLRRSLHCLSLLLLCHPILIPGSSSSTENDDEYFIEKLFRTVYHHAHHATDVTARHHAFSCLGPLLPLASQSPNKAQQGYYENAFMSLALQCSQPDQVSELRVAAARGLTASGLLMSSQSQSPPLLLVSAWDVALRLMQDEDEEVREAQRRGVVAALMAADSPPTQIIGKSVETVYKASFEYIPRCFCPSAEVLQLMCRRVCVVEGAKAELASVFDSGRDRDRKLFDTERDNHHEEGVVEVQAAARALSTILVGGRALRNDDGFSTSLFEWAHEAMVTLQEAVESPGWRALSESSAAVTAARLEVAFLPLYSLIMALWSSGDRGTLISKSSLRVQIVKDIASGIRALTRQGAFQRGLGAHPLLRAAWASVVHRWGIMAPRQRVTYESSMLAAPSSAATAAVLLTKPEGFLLDFAQPPDHEEDNVLKELGWMERRLQRNEGKSAGESVGGRPSEQVPGARKLGNGLTLQCSLM